MIRAIQFLAAFRESDEPLHLRAFKPKKAPDTPENVPQKWTTTLSGLTNNHELQQEIRTKNQHCGIYFVVNAGGDTDAEIIRPTAWFVENDSLLLADQHKRLDAAPIQPSIRVETRKSVHAYWLVADKCSPEDWREIQLRLIAYFDGDPKIKNLARVMRVPNFDHIHLNGNGPERIKVLVHTFEPERRYTVAEMREAFPSPTLENVQQRQHKPTDSIFEFHEDRHDELCQRIMARGKRNSKGNWDARGICHGGEGDTGLVYFPITGAVTCNNEPRCDYFGILRAEGLPDDHLPSHGRSTAPQSRNHEEQKDTSLAVVLMANVEREDVDWLLFPYIPVGKVTLLEGDPGIGKSWLTAALACVVSRGRGLPGTGTCEPGNVLMFSAEDGLSDTVRPRLDSVGADVTRVFALNQPLTFDEKGLLSLEEALIEYKPRLLTIDPIFAFTGSKVDIHRANECRTITARLARIAEKHDCAIVAVRHLAKSRGMGHALNAGIGSIDFAAAARSVLLAGKDPDDENKRAVVQIKNNLASLGPAIGFMIRGGEFFWTGESDLTDAKILSCATNESERPALDEASAFLRDSLSGGEREVSEVKAEARQAGISEITLRRARERLGIKAKRQGMPGMKQSFFWSLDDVQAGSDHAHKMNDEHHRESEAK